MRHRRDYQHDDTETALANFALTFAKALLVFCVVLFALISPDQKKEDGIRPKMEYLVSVEWPGQSDYDVDVWMRNPDGNVLYYHNKEVNFLSLERDDLGKLNNEFEIDGRTVAAPYHEELVAVRGFQSGEYVVNVHLYRVGTKNKGDVVEPVEVKVKIEKLNPTISTKFVGSVKLSTVGEERNVVRFNMNDAGDLTDVTTELPILIRDIGF